MSWWSSRHEYEDFEDEEEYYDEVDCSEDHVTTADAVVIEGPIRAISKRGSFGTQWWGKQWVAELEEFFQDNRLQRGRSYARNGSVKQLEINYGSVFAQVQGHYVFPYCTRIRLTPFTDTEWKKAVSALGEQAIYSAKLLAGEMPIDVESVFQSVGLSLFPRNLKDFHFDCSCPDYGKPCKHAVAVYYLLAEQIDSEPFLLFHLRGRTREQMLDALHVHRRDAIGAADENSDETETAILHPNTLPLEVDNFWSAPTSDLMHMAPSVPKHPPLLRQYGEPPQGIENDLRLIYQVVSSEALGWLGL